MIKETDLKRYNVFKIELRRWNNSPILYDAGIACEDKKSITIKGWDCYNHTLRLIKVPRSVCFWKQISLTEIDITIPNNWNI